ncbi:ogr/Delta-like zinc finger family protein [Kosakonia sacchari]|uniref:ogr/Delta-like zinc finger family protein n=1 Tax=Kosakonia sacchari TaxID=1158459 RepID=UPI0015850285|nr:ogr/Delta-like zinc finger family protein [Kosakonia sacchari]NUL35099.1 ogr/Delta-like zinc finger family protein [Kosakonia sacchari]
MTMKCPDCGKEATSRRSRNITDTLKERYYDCRDPDCGCSFVSHESFSRFVTHREPETAHQQLDGKTCSDVIASEIERLELMEDAGEISPEARVISSHFSRLRIARIPR